MKWVLLSDRLPPDFDKAIVRWEDTKELLDYSGYTLKDNGTIDIWSGSGQGVSGGNYDLNELEWLDEEAYNIKDHDPLHIKYIVLTEKYDDLKESIDTLLEEQHNNTIFDAVEAVKSYIKKWDVYEEMRDLQTIIASIKQRKP